MQVGGARQIEVFAVDAVRGSAARARDGRRDGRDTRSTREAGEYG